MGELIVNGIKQAFLISCALAFSVAIASLVVHISEFAFGGLIGELLGIFNACLPFDLFFLMNSTFIINMTIITFLVAHKVFDLSTIIVPK